MTRRQRMRKRKIRKAISEGMAAAAVGALMAAGLIWAIINDPYEPPGPPEHYGQVYYSGVWWDSDDYEQMMAEREAYLQAERESEQAFMEAVRNVQAQTLETTTSQTLIASRDWDADDSYLLAKIAMAEAEGEDTEGKALVMLVVLNRVWSEDFPDSIEEVILQEGQFSPVREGGRYYTTEPNDDCYKALEMIMLGWDESQGATYFEKTADGATWHNQNLVELFKHGNHTFYREEGDQ